jgi:hypothetical protein
MKMFYDPNCKPEKVGPYGEVLLRAVDLIEERGWCQHKLRSSEGSICTEQAIREASPGVWRLPLMHFAAFLGEAEVHHWNDDRGRTKEEVVSALRQAAYL